MRGAVEITQKKNDRIVILYPVNWSSDPVTAALWQSADPFVFLVCDPGQAMFCMIGKTNTGESL